MCSATYLLATHPSWQERLREEAREVAPDGVTMANYKKLVWHERVWKEALRLYPVSNVLPRRALRDTEVGGFPIPAGALVLGVLGPATRDPGVWADPYAFALQAACVDRTRTATSRVP